MLLVDLNYNFEFDWFVELSGNKLSDNKLSDNNLASELVGKFFNPITMEEIVIFLICKLLSERQSVKIMAKDRCFIVCPYEINFG